MEKFSISEAIRAGWEIYKANWKFLLGVSVIIIGLNFVSSYISSSIEQTRPAVAMLVGIVFGIVQTVMGIGVIKIALKLLDHEKVAFSELWQNYRLFFYYLAGTMLSGLLIVLGFVLLIIPGLILAVRLQFWPYLVIDQGMGPIKAMSASWEMTRGLTLRLFLFDLAIVLVDLLGLLLLVVGILAAWPVTTLATAFVYRKIAPSRSQ